MKTRRWSLAVLCWLALAGLSLEAAVRVIYVRQDNTNGVQTGTSWTTAYTSLQAAIAEANPTTNSPVEIWIGRGTYFPTTSTDRLASFRMKSHLRLLGGFVGNEVTDTTRDIYANPTVLSGDIGVAQSPATRIRHNTLNSYYVPFDENDPGFKDNSYNILTCAGTIDVVLEGLFFAGGNANYGVTNLTALDARLTAAYIQDMAQIVEITNVSGQASVTLDSRVAGGAIFITNSSARPDNQINLILNKCTFLNNGARGYGGAIAAREVMMLGSGCFFQNNHAGETGGAQWGQNHEAHYLGSSFHGNSARVQGGAIVYESLPSEKLAGHGACSATGASMSTADAARLQNGQFSRWKTVYTLEDTASSMAGLAMRLENRYEWGTFGPASTSTDFEFACDAMSLGYKVLSLVVSITDTATAGMDDTNNDDLKRWRIFSGGFTTYATPGGWITLFSEFLLSKLGAGPTTEELARYAKVAYKCVYNASSTFGQPSYSTLRFCNFQANSSGGGAGAVSCAMDNLQIEACKFEANRCLYDGAAIRCGSFTTPIILSTVFYQNFSTNGHSAIANVLHSRAQIINCTIVGNTSTATNGYAVGVEMGSEVKIANCILWGNRNRQAANADGGADIFAGTAATMSAPARTNYNEAGPGYIDWVGICDVSYSCVQGLQRLPLGTDIIPLFPEHRTYSPEEIEATFSARPKAEEFGTMDAFGYINLGEGIRPGLRTTMHNIDTDPRLINGYIPSAFSPVVDAGSTNKFNNGFGINLLTGADLAGTNRVRGRSVDMGAYENQGVPVAGDVIRVWTAATGDNSGRDWSNAKTNLVEAMRLPGAEVWVAQGTYLPGTNRLSSFSLGQGTKVYGGFGAGMTSRNQRDVAGYPTVLSGNIGNPNSDADNSESVVVNSGIDGASVLDGFTITAGRGAGGAGIYNNNASPTIRNCRFVDNRALASGGAIYSTGAAGSGLDNCVFLDNTAGFAGGALHYPGAVVNATNCWFSNNTATRGGAIHVKNAGSSRLYNCLFLNNRISGGNGLAFGGAIVAEGTDLAVINGTFFRNTATLNTYGTHGGAAIHMMDSTNYLQVQNSIFWENSVVNPGGGVDTRERQQIAVGANRIILKTIIDGLNVFGGTGTGNSGADPVFVDGDGGNLRLKPYSPGIDAGAGGGFPDTDLAGLYRVRNGVVDLGAYEYQSSLAEAQTEFNIVRSCDGEGGVYSFAVRTNVAGATYQWQVDANDGQGFRNLTNGGIYAGVTTTNLVILHPPLTASGYRYRVQSQRQITITTSGEITLLVRFNRLYVRAGAVGNGSSWSNALPNIRQAIDRADGCTEIWVAAGTYYPTVSGTNTGATSETMLLRTDVAIYGGFNGTETELAQRNWQANPTIISGQLGSPTNRADNSLSLFANYGFRANEVCGPSAVLDGFILTGAQASAVVAIQASPTIRNCVFTGNDGSVGAGLRLEQSGTRVVACVFSNNVAGEGAGVYALESSVSIYNSLFHGNTANHRGGAVMAVRSKLNLVNSTVARNSAQTWGGGLYTQDGTNTVQNSILWDNQARSASAALEPVTASQWKADDGSNRAFSSCWQGLTDGTDNNFGFDPLFLNAAGGNFRLDAHSPALNAGNNAYITNFSRDVANSNRFFGVVDVGAHELQASPATTVHIVSQPKPLTACTVAAGGEFRLAMADDPSLVTWEMDAGAGFVPVPAAVPYSVTVVSNTSLLQIDTLTTNLSGYLFRAVLAYASYTSAPVQLTVNPPSVIYVATTSPGVHNGTSWANAYTNLQDAIAAADTCATIWVAAGTYTPKKTAGGFDYFALKSGLPIYGGFAGTETNLSQRNWQTHSTTLLNRGADNPVLWNIGTQSARIDASAVLDGFHIRSTNQAFAAVANDFADVTIQNCIFEGNPKLALENRRSSGMLANCLFTNNTYTCVQNISGAAPWIVDCVFAGNQNALAGPAAIYNTAGASPQVERTTFAGNRGVNAGAVYNESAGSPVFTRCIFRDNTSPTGAGAMRNVGTAASGTTLDNCLLVRNVSGHIGGALDNSTGRLRLVNTTVANNRAKVQGAGVLLYSGRVEAVNSIFWGNTLADIYGNPTAEEIQLAKLSSGGGVYALTNSCVQGLAVYAGQDNFGYDPLFVDADNGNFALRKASPGIDTGFNLPNGAASDLAGNLRNFGNAVDVGAYELQEAGVPAPFVLFNPQSQRACPGESVSFTFVAKGDSLGNFHWQVDRGAGFVDLVEDATNVVTTNATTSTLTVSQVDASWNGTRYRLTAPSLPYSTPPATLTVGSPGTVFVRASASGLNNGTSWSNAYTNLQTALLAATTIGCKELWVANGTYRPSAGVDGKTTFRLSSRIALYGGFAGTESQLGDRNWTNRATILEAVPGYHIVECDSSYRPADATAVLDGFVLQGADQSAVYNGNASPTIRNCFFRNNTGGAAIENVAFANPVIVGNLFSNNLERAILNVDRSSPLIQNCVFVNNASASGSGGAIASREQSSPVIAGCVFTGNSAGEGGALAFDQASAAQVVNSIFTGNRGGYRGGAIVSVVSGLRVVNCTIYGNEAEIRGGGLYLDGTSAVLNTILWGNRLTTGTDSVLAMQLAGDAAGAGAIAHSIVQGLTVTANGNLPYDPLFTNAAGGDFRLTAFSPAVNAGNSADIAGFPVDAAGSNRVFGSAVDMGALEFPAAGAAAPARFTLTPQSVTSCSALAQVSFQAAGPDVASMLWETNTGGIFGTLVPGGNYTVTTNGDVSTLTVSGITPLMIGHQFRVHVPASGYRSAAATLTVTAPSVLYVKHNAAGANNGTSWANAFTNLHAALAAGGECSEVWVAEGTYLTAGQSFALKAGLPVLGGFVGTETNALQRDWTNHPAVLKNDGDISVFNNTGVQVDATAVLDGFVIVSTNTTPAIYNLFASPTLRHCTFAGNAGIALWNQAANGLVADCVFTNGQSTAVFNRDSAPTFLRCVFTGNRAPAVAGGAMFNDSSRPRVEACVFTNNQAAQGSAIYNQNEAAPVVVRSVFKNNRGTSGGAFADFGTGPTRLESCLFTGNTSEHLAAAIEHHASALLVVNCTVADNTSARGSAGLYSYGGPVTVVNSIFWNNRVQQTVAGLTTEGMQVFATDGTVTVSNSCVQGLAAYTGSTNTGFDPLFSGADTGNYTLNPASPALNAGRAGMGTEATDLAGAARVFGSAADLGAYELQASASAPVALLAAPAGQSVCVGNAAMFSVVVPGGSTNVFQWQMDAGGGFNPVVPGGEHTITTNSSGSVLTVSGVTAGMTGRRYRAAAVGTVFVTPAATLQISTGQILRVKAMAGGTGDGSSWANAFTNLQQALAATEGCSEIWVAEGTYVPNLMVNGYMAFTMKSGVAIYGGFAGNENNLGDRNPALHPVVLSPAAGEQATFQNLGYLRSIDASAVLDGFTLSGASGYAIYNVLASPTLRNCRFQDNAGTGLVNDVESAPTVSACVFTNNQLGGILLRARSRADISDSIFDNNATTGSGAAIFAHDGSQPTVTRCVFRNNQAQGDGGAINIEDSAAGTVTRSLFLGNTAANLGGALKIKNAVVALDNLELLDNRAFRGGALSFSGTNLVVRHATISGNEAKQGGGAIFAAAGNVAVQNSILWANHVTQTATTPEEAQLGFFNGGTFAIEHSTLAGATVYAGNGNSSYDPLLVTRGDGSLGLQANSPAVNAGNNALAVGLVTDYAGSNRLFGAHVDMGAVEWPQAAGAPLALLSAPATAAGCAGGDIVLGVVSATSLNVTWQINGGSGFTNVITNATYAISETATSSVLRIVAATPGMNGQQLRYLVSAGGFTSAWLTVSIGQTVPLYVNAAATGANNGTSWANAFTNLGPALSSADQCNEIWVARGTYRPEPAWSLKSGLGVYGGFAGTETNRNQRNVAANASILTSAGDTLFYNDGTLTPIDATAVLDGFTVSNVTALIAINNNQASPSFRQCTFTGNAGWSIYNRSSHPQITDCTFAHNTQSAIYNRSSSPVIRRSAFTGHQVTDLRGVIRNLEVSSPQIEDSLFADNQGGGIYSADGSVPVIERSVFRNNESAGDGGALFNSAGAGAVIRNSLFTGNRSDFNGGAIAHHGGILTLVNCTVTDNTGTYGSGGIYNQGTLVQGQNNLFWGNRVKVSSGVPNLEKQQLGGEGAYALTFSGIQGLSALAGNNNLPYDPLFVNPVIGNYGLLSNSPAINAGSTAGFYLPGTDLAGSNRLAGASVDLGAFEFAGAPGAPVQLILLPRSTTTCLGAEARFTAITANGQTVQWQRWNSAAYVPVTESVDFHLSVNGTTNTLEILNESFVGTTFRMVLPGEGFFSPDLIFQPAARRVIYVSNNGAPGGDGSTWGQALPGLAEALGQADECTDIWMAKGTYRPTTTDPGVSYHLRPNVRIFGGFAGTETNLTQRNWRTNETVLSGEIGVSGDRSDNLDVVVDGFGFNFRNGLGAGAVLDGVVIEGARAAGISVWVASPTFRNCVIRNNARGVKLLDGDSLFENCVVAENGAAPATEGAGIRIQSCAPTFRNCFVTNNAAGTALGGGIYSEISTWRMENCVVAGNTAYSAAGIRHYYDTNVVILNSTVANNIATLGPLAVGEIVLSGAPAGIFAEWSVVAVRNSIVWGNVAGGNSSELAQLDSYQHSLNTVDLVASNSCIENLNSFTNANNTAANPLFVAEAARDYRLLPCSPLIDAGNSNYVTAGVLDLAGLPRVASTSVDIGAFEYPGGRSSTSVTIFSEPQDLSYCAGSQFYVGATSPGGALTYQWYGDENDGRGFVALTNGGSYVGVNTEVLTLGGAGEQLNGRRFRCEVSEATGCAAISRTATLSYKFRRWYVNVNRASGPPMDGTSWETAYYSLQGAVAAVGTDQFANGTCDGEFWMAEGTYYSGIGGAADVAFLPEGYDLYGGFAGTETNVSQRVVASHPTILRGLKGLRSGNPADYLEHVLIAPGGRPVRIDGMTIFGGRSGIVCLGNHEIVNCTFQQNVHGIECSHVRPKITGCLFEGNSAYIVDQFGFGTWGGGIATDGYGITVENCVFRNNSAYNFGAAARINVYYDGETTIFRNCLFHNNLSDGPGGVVDASQHGDFLFENCTFSGNINSRGGSVSTALSAGSIDGRVDVNNCIFADNSTQQLSIGNSVWVNGALVYGQPLSNPHQSSINYGDPLFVGGGDFRLQPCSPAINAGSNLLVTALTDLGGLARISGGRVDLGAYERPIFTAITGQPQNQTSVVTAAIQFAVGVNTNAVGYRWQSSTNGINFTDLTESATYIGVSNATLTVTNLTPALHGTYFRARVTSEGCLNLFSEAARYFYVNTPPTAFAQDVYLDEDTATTFTLTGTDPDGTAPIFALVASPTNGTATLGSGATFTYRPNTNFFGLDRVRFKALDATAESAVVEIVLHVASVNDTPVALGQTVAGTEDVLLPITLLGTDVENDPLTFVIVTPPVHGFVTGAGLNAVYHPDTNYHGADSFTFKVTDGAATSAAPATVSLTLAPVNDLPVATNDAYALILGNTLTLPVLQNDYDPEGDSTITSVTVPAHGTAVIAGTNVVYTHDNTFTAADVFSYVLRDPSGATSTGQVSLTIDTNISYVVGITNDNGAGSLRAGVEKANQVHGHLFTITFQTNLRNSSLVLTNIGDRGQGDSALVISNRLVIDATAVVPLTVWREGFEVDMRLLRILPGAEVTLKKFRLARGSIVGQNGQNGSLHLVNGGGTGSGGGEAGLGGGIFNEGTLTLDGMLLDGNTAAGGTGGIMSFGDGLTVGNGGGVNGGQDNGNRNGGFGGGGAGGNEPASGTGLGGQGGFGAGSAVGGTNHAIANAGKGGFGGGGGGAGAASGQGILPTYGGVGLAAGGAIFNRGGHLVLTNCYIGINSVAQRYMPAEPEMRGMTMGSALFNYNGQVEIFDTEFQFNYNPDGGEFFNLGDGALASITMENIRITSQGPATNLIQTNLNGGFASALVDSQSVLSQNSPYLRVSLTNQVSRGPFTQDFILEAPAHLMDSVVVTSATPALLSSSDVYFGGAGSNQTLYATPAFALNGTAKVVLGLTDGALSMARYFYAKMERDFQMTARFRQTTNVTVFPFGNLTISGIIPPAHGTVTFGLRDLTYRHGGSTATTDVFQYIFTDGTSTATGQVQVVVGPGNNAPVVTNQSVTTPQELPRQIQLAATDTEADLLVFTIKTQPLHGTLTGSNFTYVYTPAPGFSGSDSFTYVASDIYGESAMATVSITVESRELVVSTAADAGPGSLRAALALANAAPTGGWHLILSNSLAGQGLSLTTIGDTNFGPSALLVGANVEIDASALPGFVIGRAASAPQMRLFRVAPTGSLKIKDVILEGGYAAGGNGGNGPGGGGGGAGMGGAIFSQGTVTLEGTLFRDNVATGGAGGHYAATSVGGKGGGQNGGTGGAAGHLNAYTDAGFGSGGGGGGSTATSGLPGLSTFGGGQSGRGVNPLTGGSGGTGGFGGGGGGGSLAGGGGGMGAGGAIFNYEGVLTVSNAVFAGNRVVGGAGGNNASTNATRAFRGEELGAAIFNLSGVATLVDTDIRHNTGLGAALYNCHYTGFTNRLFLSRVSLRNPWSGTDVESSLSNTETIFEDTVPTYPGTNFSMTEIPDVFLPGPGTTNLAFQTVKKAPYTFAVTATSDNQSVVPDGGLTVTGTGTNLTLAVQTTGPGTAVVTVKGATDVNSMRTLQTFRVTVGARRNFTVKIAAGGTASIPVAQSPAETATGFTPAAHGAATLAGDGKHIDYANNLNDPAKTDAFVFTGTDGGQSFTGTVQVVVTHYQLTVTNLSDAGPGSLRAALAQAGQGPGNYFWKIGFDPGLAGQTISLSSIGDTSSGPSALKVQGRVELDAVGIGALTVARSGGAPAMRLFKIESGAELTLNGVSLGGGLAQGGAGQPGEGGGGGGAGLGGAVYNRGAFSAYDAVLANNVAQGGSGGGASVTGSAGAGGGLNGLAAGGTAQFGAGGAGAGAAGVTGNAGAAGYAAGKGGGQSGTPGSGLAGGFGGGGGGAWACGGGAGTGLGGAIFNDGGSVIISNVTLTANEAAGGTPGGGSVAGATAISRGGGVFNYNGNLKLEAVTMTGSSTHGAGVYSYSDGLPAAVAMATVTMNGSGTNFVQEATTNGFASAVGDALNVGTRSRPWVGDLPDLTLLEMTTLPVELGAPLGAASNYVAASTWDNPAAAFVQLETNGVGGWQLDMAPFSTGVGTVTVSVQDGNVSMAETFRVTIPSIPVVNTDSFTAFDTQVVSNINVLANDIPGTPGSTLTILDFSGTGVTMNPDSTFNWDPGTRYRQLRNGQVQSNLFAFSYRVLDVNGAIVSGSAVVTVIGTNQAPGLDPLTLYRQPGSAVKMSAAWLNDLYIFDPEADSYTLSVPPASTQGAGLKFDGSHVIYEGASRPDTDDSFVLYITDAGGARSTNLIPVIVTNAFTVTTGEDGVPGCLRDAMDEANLSRNDRPWVIHIAPEAGDTIDFFFVHPDTRMGRSSEVVAGNVVIAHEAAPLIIRRAPGAGTGRLFYVTPTGQLTLRNVLLTGGNLVGAAGRNASSGSGGAAGLGGAILNEGTLALQSVTATGNTTTGGRGGNVAGGLPGPGALPFGGAGNGGLHTGFGGGDGGAANCVGSGGSGAGGALFNLRGTVTIADSQFAANTALGGARGTGNICAAVNGQAYAGAIFNYNGNMTVRNTVVSNNAAQNGSGIYNLGDGAASVLRLDGVVMTNSGGGVDLTAVSTNGGSTLFRGNQNVIGSRTGPWIGDIADMTEANPTGFLTANFGVSLPTGSPGALVFSAASAEASVVANAELALSGSGGSRTLTITPVPWRRGRTTITVSAVENGNKAVEEFILQVGLFTTLKLDGPELVLQLKGEPGHTYNVEFTPSLTVPNWTMVGTAVEVTPGQFEFRQTRPVSQQGYYRLVEDSGTAVEVRP